MHQDSRNPWTFSFVNDSQYTVCVWHFIEYSDFIVECYVNKVVQQVYKIFKAFTVCDETDFQPN